MTDPTETHTEAEFEASLVEHDEWFRHSVAEPHHQDSHGDTKTLVILLFMAVTVIFVFTTGMIVLKYFESEARQLKTDFQEPLVGPRVMDLVGIAGPMLIFTGMLIRKVASVAMALSASIRSDISSNRLAMRM